MSRVTGRNTSHSTLADLRSLSEHHVTEVWEFSLVLDVLNHHQCPVEPSDQADVDTGAPEQNSKLEDPTCMSHLILGGSFLPELAVVSQQFFKCCTAFNWLNFPWAFTMRKIKSAARREQ